MNILKKSFRLLLIVVFSSFATKVARAKTIDNSVLYASDSQLQYVENVYKRSGYKHFLLGLENTDNYYNTYYLCLSNNDVVVGSQISASLDCEEMYRYYRSSNNYILEKVNDNNLSITNSVYYTSNIYDTNFEVNRLLICLNIGILTFFLCYVLFKLFRG